VEALFVTSFDALLKGGTTSICSPDSEKRPFVKKKRDAEDDAMQLLLQQRCRIL
jgi:hypothetical protein